MKGVIFVIVCVAILFVAAIGFTKAIQKEVQQQIATQRDEPMAFVLYVFDREKEVWNRATKADLKTANCEDLRMFPVHAMHTQEAP